MTAQSIVTGSSDRAFGLVFAGAFAVLGVLPLLGGRAVRWWSLAVAVAFVILALCRPGVLAPLNRTWTFVGAALHRVVSPLVMGLVFFVTITPIGLLLRVTGKDLLRLKIDPDATSYWIERRPPGPASGTMRHQF